MKWLAAREATITPGLAELSQAQQALPVRGGRRRHPEALKARGAAFYTFADSRSALISRQALLGFDGLLQGDGLALCSALASDGGPTPPVSMSVSFIPTGGWRPHPRH